MGLMDKSATKEEFDSFSQKVLEEIQSLKKSIELKSSDSERNIKSIEENVEQSYIKIQQNESSIENGINQIEIYKGDCKEYSEKLKKIQDDWNIILEEVEQQQVLVLSKKDEILTSSLDVNEKIQTIENALETAKTLPENIKNIEELIEVSKGISEEIEALKKHSMDKKSKIDELYDEIYGKDINIENENKGVATEHTDGIKDKLKTTYNNLNSQIEKLDDLLNKSIEKSSSKFNELLENSQNSYKKVDAQLKTLLPGAMASGLSSAYVKKTEDEKKSQKELESNFKKSLLGLILVSLIPIIIDIYRLIWIGAPLLEVIKDTPILIISMLPIYSPILWFAHSSSKKLNLSKRLIEEYTHKAVLGNTFEGLSTQIEGLSANDSIRDELRVKLLFNLLQVSSENPGKLITDYQTSDHPLMEALENSVKLSSSIDKLNKIPGFSAIAKRLSTERNNIINKADQDVECGLNKQDDINKKDNE